MKRAWFSIFVFGFLALVSPANAGSFDTGNDLLEKCASKNPFSEGVCYGVASGHFEGMQMAYT